MRIPGTGGPGARAARACSGLLALIFCLISMAGCGDASQAQSPGTAGTTGGQEEQTEAEDAIAVEVAAVALGSPSAVYATSATLRADKQATVAARTRGVVRSLLVEEGDWVEEGQPLANLENDEQRIAFDQSSATYETKRREFQRAEQLHAQELLSDEEFDTARREAVEAEHTAALAELALSRTVIRATFSGRVLVRHLDVGATVSDGTAVFDIADLDPLYADVQVPERQVAQLEPGQLVRLASESGGSGAAEIERIAPAVDPSTGTVKVTLAARRAGKLRPGSFVRVAIVTDTHENVLVVQRSALVAEGRRWHLFRLSTDDPRRVELVEVERGFEEGDHVEIVAGAGTERPLSEGDRVVVTGASSLSDGSAVQVLGEEGDAEAASEDEEPGVAS